MSRESNVLFNDLFTIHEIDKEGKRFDRVSRLQAQSDNYDMTLVLDYNVELYPLNVGERFTFTLASSLARGGMAEDEESPEAWRPGRVSKGIDEDYDYVMYGRVYKFDDAADAKVTVYASFGGLLMALAGSFRHLQSILLGENVYLLMRK